MAICPRCHEVQRTPNASRPYRPPYVSLGRALVPPRRPWYRRSGLWVSVTLLVATVAGLAAVAAHRPESAATDAGTPAVMTVATRASQPRQPETTDGSTGGEASYSEFARALTAGAECATLYEIRNRMDPHGEDKLRANDALSIEECFSIDSHRRVALSAPTPDFVIRDYQLSYRQCRDRAARVYAESRALEPEAAAEWFSLTLQEGPHRRGSYQGCLDALGGQVSRFPE